MNIAFNFDWTSPPKEVVKGVVETEISDAVKACDIEPCHSNAIIISLGISGDHDTILKGSIKCNCGKTLGKFEGYVMTFKDYAAVPRLNMYKYIYKHGVSHEN